MRSLGRPSRILSGAPSSTSAADDRRHLVVEQTTGEAEMSIFPTKILLATDGSREAALAAHIAAQIADETGSELHIVYVLPRSVPLHPGHLVGPEVEEHWLQREQEHLEREAQLLLDT